MRPFKSIGAEYLGLGEFKIGDRYFSFPHDGTVEQGFRALCAYDSLTPGFSGDEFLWYDVRVKYEETDEGYNFKLTEWIEVHDPDKNLSYDELNELLNDKL